MPSTRARYRQRLAALPGNGNGNLGGTIDKDVTDSAERWQGRLKQAGGTFWYGAIALTCVVQWSLVGALGGIGPERTGYTGVAVLMTGAGLWMAKDSEWIWPRLFGNLTEAGMKWLALASQSVGIGLATGGAYWWAVVYYDYSSVSLSEPIPALMVALIAAFGSVLSFQHPGLPGGIAEDQFSQDVVPPLPQDSASVVASSPSSRSRDSTEIDDQSLEDAELRLADIASGSQPTSLTVREIRDRTDLRIEVLDAVMKRRGLLGDGEFVDFVTAVDLTAFTSTCTDEDEETAVG